MAAFTVWEQHYTHVVIGKEGLWLDFDCCLVAVLSSLLIAYSLLDNAEVVLHAYLIVERIFDGLEGAHRQLPFVELFKCHGVVRTSLFIGGRLLKNLVLLADDHSFHVIGAG